MKDEIKNISLSFVCQENWNNFHGHGQARFCDKCQKTVIDFTNATTVDLQRKMAEPAQSICGRFKYKQVNPAFARNATAAIAIASSLSACQPDFIEPPLQQKFEIPQIVMEEEIFLMGDVMELPQDTILFIPDSLANKLPQ